MDEKLFLEEVVHDQTAEARRLLPPALELLGARSDVCRKLERAIETGLPQALDEAFAAIARLSPAERARLKAGSGS